jgi:4-amino-4-deoxy-L-arabinose transferase-like glycosyltransferase
MTSPLPTLTPERRRWAIALAIFLLVSTVIGLTARGPGITWDEPIYLGFALKYLAWFADLPRTFTAPIVGDAWWRGQVHPPLGKLYIALSFKLFGGVADPKLAIRLGAGMLFGAAAALLFLKARARRGEAAGLCAAAVFVFMPRLFAHGHFANLEMMTLLLWLATTLAFERGIRSRLWSVLCGVLFGLALLTKINGAFLPIFLAPWGLLFHGRKALRNLVCMALIGPAMFLGGWPPLWFDTVGGIRFYLRDKLIRGNIGCYYLGTRYWDRTAPWHYPFVMFLATTPLPVLLAAFAGVRRFVRGLRINWREHSYEALLLWGFLFPVLLLAMPGVPKYDGIRLMLPAYPFLALIVAEGGVAMWEYARKRWGRFRAQAATVAAATWLLLPVVAFDPFQLCYYGELAGGPWGAKRLGFETTYWNETFDDDALSFLNKHVPPNGSIAYASVGEMVGRYYHVFGGLREDIRQGDFYDRDWEYLVVVPRQDWLNKDEVAFIASHEPVWVKGLPPFGTPPICLIYSLPPAP